MKKSILLMIVFLLSFSTVGCSNKEDTTNENSRMITLDNLNYSKEDFEQEYVDYLFFVKQSLQEMSGGDNSAVVYHKTYKLNKEFTKDNLVSTQTINQAEEYLQTMKVQDLKYLLNAYISYAKEIHEDFVYAANNPNVTEDNVIQINKDILTKLENKVKDLSEEEYFMTSPILNYFVLAEDISDKVDYSISMNKEFSKENTLNKLKLVANENIVKQLLDSIYS